MNFVDAQCVIEGDKVTLNIRQIQRCIIPPAKAKKLIDGGYARKDSYPWYQTGRYHVMIPRSKLKTFKSSLIEADVTGYELLGAEVLLYFQIGGANFTAKVDSRTPARMGDHVRFAFDPQQDPCI